MANLLVKTYNYGYFGQRILRMSFSLPSPQSVASSSASLHTSPVQELPGETWRKQRGLAANATSYGPLTDGPDYSYLDGRPTPPGAGKIKRAKEQREIGEKVLQLSDEVDFAVSRHLKLQEKRTEMREKIIQNKLKPKGNLPPEF